MNRGRLGARTSARSEVGSVATALGVGGTRKTWYSGRRSRTRAASGSGRYSACRVRNTFCSATSAVRPCPSPRTLPRQGRSRCGDRGAARTGGDRVDAAGKVGSEDLEALDLRLPPPELEEHVVVRILVRAVPGPPACRAPPRQDENAGSWMPRPDATPYQAPRASASSTCRRSGVSDSASVCCRAHARTRTRARVVVSGRWREQPRREMQ